MWILLVEDEKRLRESLCRGLEEEGHTVDGAADGEEGLAMAVANGYDVLIVDWRLPRRDGRALIEAVREAGRACPILMLTALGDTGHRVAGLDAGADDYLAKPFSFEELLARLRALGRRPPLMEQERVLTAGALTLDTDRRQARFREARLNLRPKEYALLLLLLRNPGRVLSRSVIAERAWGDAFYVSDNAIDVTVSSLRQKLEDARSGLGETETASDKPAAERPVAERLADDDSPSPTARIETIRGVGYRLHVMDQPH